MRRNMLKRTHALTPQSHQIRVGRSPSRGKHGIESTGKALNYRESTDARGHGTECDGSKRSRRNMANGKGGCHDKTILKKVGTVKL